MTRRIFRAIFAVAITVFLAAMGLIFSYLHGYFNAVQFSQLRAQTALAAQAVTHEGLAYFESLDETLECRITWIAADGTVLYDNSAQPQSMPNHLQREEVISALQTGYGQSARHSDTLLERYIYAAQRLPDGTILRLSMAQSSMLNLILSLSGGVALAVLVTVILSYVLASRLSQRILEPINSLNLDQPLSNTVYEEVSPLLRRLDQQQHQLRHQETELRQKQKEFNTVTRSMSEGLVLISATGTILSINPAAARLLEVTPNCLGADFPVANRNPAIAALVDKALAGEKGEQTVSLLEGSYLAAASPVRSGGIQFGVVLLLFDVTQKHQNELLRREFTANVSHELKTPLHVISGYAELMQSGLVPPQDMEIFAAKIYTEAQRMTRLVEDTLRLSHLDEGAAGLQWMPVDLYATVQAVLRELAVPAELAGVTLTLEGQPTQIQAIPQLVSAIVTNLIDNGIKYNCPGGSVAVTLRQTPSGTILKISDTGIGIPESQQERIFERFYRVDKSHSKAVGGTGLGLSIVKHAALILNAKLTLTSTPNRGTTVEVLF